jgi:cytoskeletal protein RodZ
MALFRKKDSNEQIPAELERYYDRPTWQVWLRRIGALAIVVFILLAVFMLARAVYRNVTDDGDNAGKNSSQSQSEAEKKNTDNQDKQKSSQSQESNSDKKNNSQSQDAQTGQGTAIPRTGDDPTDQPPAGTTPSSLPRTGDDPSDPLPPGYTQ